MSFPTSTRGTPAAALFDQESQARQAVQALGQQGVAEQQATLYAPGTSDVDLGELLLGMGMPEGEVRFYTQAVHDGQTLVVVDPASTFGGARDVLLASGGYDVQSRGGELATADGAGVPGGTGPRPVDVTGAWDDVASRYEMLWQQHYGTTDQTWEQMAPLYEYAWQLANDARYRGRPWADVEAVIQQDWQSSQPQAAWADVAGPIRDVWEDVAEEAAMGAEGGRDRRIARQGTDQSVAAREVAPPR